MKLGRRTGTQSDAKYLVTFLSEYTCVPTFVSLCAYTLNHKCYQMLSNASLDLINVMRTLSLRSLRNSELHLFSYFSMLLTCTVHDWIPFFFGTFIYVKNIAFVRIVHVVSVLFPYMLCPWYMHGCGMQTEDAYSSGHLVLSHFGTCMCSNVETNLSWTCLVSGPLNFEHPSVLLFCLAN